MLLVSFLVLAVFADDRERLRLRHEWSPQVGLSPDASLFLELIDGLMGIALVLQFALFGLWVGYLARSALRPRWAPLPAAVFLLAILAPPLALLAVAPVRMGWLGFGLSSAFLGLWMGHLIQKGVRPTGVALLLVLALGVTLTVGLGTLLPASWTRGDVLGVDVPLLLAAVAFGLSGAVGGALGLTVAFAVPLPRAELLEPPACTFCTGPIADILEGGRCDRCARPSHYGCRAAAGPEEGLINCPLCGSIPGTGVPGGPSPPSVVDSIVLRPDLAAAPTTRWRELARPPRYGLLRSLLSWPLSVAVVLAALAMSVGFIARARVTGVGDPAALAGGALVGYGLLQVRTFARRLRAPFALRKVRRDRRPPILFLRAFGDDQIPLAPANTRQTLWAMEATVPAATFEEALCDHLGACGPVVAIGRPGENLPPLGAARFWVSDADWQRAVDVLLAESQLVAMVLGRVQEYAGLTWEAERLFHLVPPSKVVLVVPPLAEEEVECRWEAYRRLSGGRMPPYRGGEIALTFDDTGGCRLAVNSGRHERNDAAYKAALRIQARPGV